MNVLNSTSYKERFELHEEIHHPIAINSCQVKERYNNAITCRSGTL